MEEDLSVHRNLCFFLRSAGFKRTSSGEIFLRPEKASTFLSNNSAARSTGTVMVPVGIFALLRKW